METVKFLENEVFNKLEKERDLYSPLVITEVNRNDALNHDKDIDGFLKLTYQDKDVQLLIEVKSRTAPKIVETGITNLLRLTNKLAYSEFVPALLVPYLSEKIIARLKENSMSGLDLNGNYYINTPGFLAIRLDQKNQYKESAYIKDIYSRNSSIVGRFLLRNNTTYERVSDIYEGINKIGSNITFSTISKVIKGYEEQLIISREKNLIKLIQPDKLLLNLKENYIAPPVQGTLKINLPENRFEAKRLLFDLLGRNWIWSGESCAEFYTTTTPPTLFTVFSRGTHSPGLLENFSTRFYNYFIYILQPTEEYVFFDSKDNKASKLQTYLELSQLDKREKEIAKDIEKDILNEFRR